MKLLRILILTAAGLLPYELAAQNIQNVTYTSGQTVSGSSVITAGPAVLVPSGITVTYQASSSITLRPGFTAAAGSNFRAYIGSGPGNGTYALFVIDGEGDATGLAPGSVRTITANPPPSGESFTGWVLLSGQGTLADLNSAVTTFTMAASDATVVATYSSAGEDTDMDGVPNTVEVLLGLNPNDPTDVNVHRYNYDRINQLKSGPGGQYPKDKEGNIRSVSGN